GPALRARGGEFLRLYAHRHAGAAVVAVRAIGERAAAPEARAHELAVNGPVDEMAGGRHLGTRHAVGQIAAWVRSSCVKLQYRQRKLSQISHCPAATCRGSRDSLPIPRAFG